MVDEGPEHIVLRYLRNIDGKVDALRQDMRDVKLRLSGVEGAVNAVRRDILALAEDNARQQVANDHLDERIERIETRLNLSEAV